MPSRRPALARKTPAVDQRKSSKKGSAPLAAVLSFLKDTRGIISWARDDMAATLHITKSQADEAVTILSLQGYIRAAEEGRWMTSIAGENISSSAAPHYQRETVERTLLELSQRIQQFNKDRQSGAKVVKAVAFGDFLSGSPRVQAADVGIQLQRREDAETESKIFAMLRDRSPLLHLRRYEEWMSKRTHRDV
jgi:hypothetical protein